MAHDYKCTELRAIAISHKPLALSDQLCNIPIVTARLCTLIVVAFTLFVPTAGHGGGPVDLRAHAQASNSAGSKEARMRLQASSAVVL
jgi:hypothetical protein